MKRYYIIQEDNRNAFWSIDETSPTSATVEFGRVGLKGQSKVHKFGSPGERNRFISTKINEKERKGYRETTEDKLSAQTDIAESLGTQNKIIDIIWGESDAPFRIAEEFTPSGAVLVKIENSWKKTLRYVLMTATTAFEVDNVRKVGATYQYVRTGVAEVGFVEAIRKTIQSTIKAVHEIMENLVVNRKLTLVSGVEEEPTVPTGGWGDLANKVSATSIGGSISASAIEKIASMSGGGRRLELF